MVRVMSRLGLPLRGECSGNASEVGLESDVRPSGSEHGLYRFKRPPTEFKDEPPTGAKDALGLVDECLVVFVSRLTAEKSEMRLMVPDFALQAVRLVESDVGRVGDDDVEGFGGEGREPVRGGELHGGAEVSSIGRRDVQSIERDVTCPGFGSGFEGEGYGNGSGAAAGVEDLVALGNTRNGGSDDMFGFWTRDEHGRRDGEFAAVEFLRFGDVLRRFATKALVKITPVVDPGEFAELVG